MDVIYISTPHNTHIGYLRKALKNGKHVLCEKSITLNSAELSEAAELAQEHHVVLAEAMTIYHMPIYRRLLDIGVYALSLARWFFSETPDQITSQVRFAPTGVDEQASILLMNPKEEMAGITLSLHAKQPKRATLSYDRAYIEIFEYPRASEAVITWTEDGRKEVLREGDTKMALSYEVSDMEKTILTGEDAMYLSYSRDVMKIMTKLRQDWGMKYPEEE